MFVYDMSYEKDFICTTVAYQKHYFFDFIFPKKKKHKIHKS